MLNFDPFVWWAVSISGGTVFLILVSIYLYASSRTKRKESKKSTSSVVRFGGSFAFVWVLIGLLAFYIVSVNIGSAALFAAGNIIVEAILIVYLIRNRQKKSEESKIHDK